VAWPDWLITTVLDTRAFEETVWQAVMCHESQVSGYQRLLALPPEQLGKAIEGMEALAKNGFRYPFPQYGIQQDVRAGMAVSYPDRK